VLLATPERKLPLQRALRANSSQPQLLRCGGQRLTSVVFDFDDSSTSDSPVIFKYTREGEVKKIDLEAGKVTIKHGPIKHMDMPGMTMVFTAKDKALLANVKPGDKVEFMVINEGGKMIVTDLKGAR
jgi:Cu/Ag efflux protein CusF